MGLLSEPHHFCTRKTIGALRRQQPASLAPSANSKEPTHPHLDEHRARPAQAQCLSVSVSIRGDPGRGRGYGRPRPVAVGGAPRAKRAAAASSGEEIIQSIHQHLLKLPEVKQEDRLPETEYNRGVRRLESQAARLRLYSSYGTHTLSTYTNT